MIEDASAAAPGASTIDLFRDGRAGPTILLNLGVSFHAVNVFIITTVMPSVVDDIGGVALYAWPAMLYMVGTITGAACGEPVLAAVGRRTSFVVAAAVFAVGAAGSASAPSMAMLLVAHLVQGFGGGLLVSLSMALVGTFYDGGLRTRILAALSVTWGIAALVGPPIGGIFAEIGWWRGAFWISVPPIVVFAWAAWRMIPASGRTAAGAGWPFHRLALLALAVVAVGISGQVVSSGDAPAPAGAIELGAIGTHGANAVKVALILAAVVLVWRALRLDARSARPLFPSRAMSLSSPIGVAYWVYFLLSFTHIAIAVFMPLVLKVLHGVGPLWLGVFATVFSIAWTLGSVVAAGWSGARAETAMWAGMAVTATALAGLAVGTASASLWVLAGYITVIGIGIGVANVHAVAWAISTAPAGEETITASAMPAIRALGIAFGSAAAGLIANTAGLAEGASHAVVASAMTWVYAINVIPPAVSVYLVFRMLRLAEGERRAAA